MDFDVDKRLPKTAQAYHRRWRLFRKFDEISFERSISERVETIFLVGSREKYNSFRLHRFGLPSWLTSVPMNAGLELLVRLSLIRRTLAHVLNCELTAAFS